MNKNFLWSVEDGIGRLTFNRPEQANALSLGLRDDMLDAIARVAESDARVAVLSGTGRMFCAGGDIGEFALHRDQISPLLGDILGYVHPAVQSLASLPMPLICALNGPLGGAGIGFALCGDFVLASDTVKLRGGYCALALSPDGGASYLLTRRVGAAKAKRIFMLNRALSAEDCLRLGIVDEVHPAAEFADAVDRLARELAAGPTAAFARVKRLCDTASMHTLPAHLELEAALMQRSATSADFQEGLDSFREKRAARFAGWDARGPDPEMAGHA